MAACRSAIERKTPRRMRWRVILEKKFSTALSQEAEVGVKWKGPARMARQPGKHFGMVMGGVVVEHRMDQLPGWDLVLDGIEETDEFAVAGALHAAANDAAVEHAERGKQGGGAVALVVMRHGLAAAWFDRQPWLSAVERLDLALFVERKHHSMRGWIDIETDNVGEFGRKTGVARALEGPQAMRLQVVRPPDALH